MATYNGSKYVEAQLRSILSQIGSGDEVVIVDDASTDATCNIIRGLNDSRIRLVRNSSNSGPLRSFEKALLESTGDLLFLTDQDDIWLPAKVPSILQAFAENPTAKVVTSDSSLIDENGTLLAPSYYATRGGFTTSIVQNLIRCRYQGCNMAFRRSLLADCLPYPRGYFMLAHDIWIGMGNTLLGGQTVYLNQPLLLYRRHPANFSHPLGKSHQIRVRVHLMVALLLFWLTKHFISRRHDGEN